MLRISLLLGGACMGGTCTIWCYLLFRPAFPMLPSLTKYFENGSLDDYPV
jgi:hypothetical protein